MSLEQVWWKWEPLGNTFNSCIEEVRNRVGTKI